MSWSASRCSSTPRCRPSCRPPSPMSVDVPTQVLLVLLLGSARAAAWLIIAPPFSSKAVPGPIKALLSVVLALPLLGRSDLALPSLDTASVVTALVWQVLTGAALGFLCYVIFAA